MRTRVYIDGYNLYYGCLNKTGFKWLDVLSLFERQILPTILHKPSAHADPVKMVLHPDCAIKYFTAKILGNAAKSKDSKSSQDTYHNALETHSKGRASLIFGYYSSQTVHQYRASTNGDKKRIRDCEKILVWKLEEKQSDVNLALNLYDDALSGDIDQVVLVTNDTDLAPALAMLKMRCPHIVRGLVIPTRKSAAHGRYERQSNTTLEKLADWTRHHITDEELRASQLQDVVLGPRKASIKPHSWYAKPQHLAKMLEMALPVLGSEKKVMQWARKECEHLGGRRPVDLIETDEGAAAVFSYIESYIRGQRGSIEG